MTEPTKTTVDTEIVEPTADVVVYVRANLFLTEDHPGASAAVVERDLLGVLGETDYIYCAEPDQYSESEYRIEWHPHACSGGSREHSDAVADNLIRWLASQQPAVTQIVHLADHRSVGFTLNGQPLLVHYGVAGRGFDQHADEAVTLANEQQ